MAPMVERDLPHDLRGKRIHLVGAKGTGVAAFAEILSSEGARLSGSDVADTFYTDEILRRLALPLSVGFEAGDLPEGTDLVIYSPAYRPECNPQLLEAARRGLCMLSYPEALGAFSRRQDSSAVAGVHGKTTTTALAGSILAALSLPVTVLAGSAVSSFGGGSTLIRGGRYFVAETCEYRRHFLSFAPRRIVLTSVEPDHQDYYPTYESILGAFVDFTLSLPEGGLLIYCSDDEGAREVASVASRARADLKLLPYGRSASGEGRLLEYSVSGGKARFRLAGWGMDFELHIPGEHIALDATAALCLAFSILRTERSEPKAGDLLAVRSAIAAFAGSKRRSEIVGEAGGVLFMDDYGHHPTAIRETIRGVKSFWPERRLIVDFMSHTYSRTAALFDEFVSCLDGADRVILHNIYPSARESPDPLTTGAKLCAAVTEHRRRSGVQGAVSYYAEPGEALEDLLAELGSGDLFLTMGAGDNWKLGKALFERKSGGSGAG
jgi:UDP-N-acetylmuramate--alanine ligase